MKIAWLALVLAVVPVKQALSWGQEGHSIIAELAERRLDAATFEKAKSLLRTESPSVSNARVSLASIASWADDYRAEHIETTNWHFVDIPYERNTYNPALDCKTDPKLGYCIINAIDRSQKTLANCAKPATERLMALKFLVHFVGDVHQPLHSAERNGDHGGNDVMVTFHGQPMKLHAVWDTGLIMRTVYAWGAYVTRLETTWFPGRNVSGLDGGNPVNWALEAHRFAHDVAYDLPDGNVLGDDYYRKALPVVDRQLAVAGLRLTKTLKDTLRTVSCPR